MKKVLLIVAVSVFVIFGFFNFAWAYCDEPNCPGSTTIGISGKSMSESFTVADDGLGNFAAGQTAGMAKYESIPNCNPTSTEGWAQSIGTTTANIESGENFRNSNTCAISEDSTEINGYGALEVKSTQGNEGATFINNGPTAGGYYAGNSSATGTTLDHRDLDSIAMGHGCSLSEVTITPTNVTATNTTYSFNMSKVNP